MRVVFALLVAASLGAACAEPSTPPVAAPAPTAPPPVDAAVPDAAPTASEIEARRVLEAAFRGAGLRVLVDVPFELPGGATVTLDGFDPARGIGYEYVAAAERDTDLDAGERRALEADAPGILVLDAAPIEAIAERAAAFLATVPPAVEP